MREIKFKAKSVCGGAWVYGNFIHSKRFEGCPNEYRIHNQDTGIESDVWPETVCEFTGMVDRKGIEIYEHDIVEYCNADGVPRVGIIRYHKDGFEIFKNGIFDRSLRGLCKIEVIGNVHDK